MHAIERAVEHDSAIAVIVAADEVAAVFAAVLVSDLAAPPVIVLLELAFVDLAPGDLGRDGRLLVRCWAAGDPAAKV